MPALHALTFISVFLRLECAAGPGARSQPPRMVGHSCWDQVHSERCGHGLGTPHRLGKWANFCRPVSHEIKKVRFRLHRVTHILQAFGTASLAVVLESLLTGSTTDEQESLRTLLACESSEVGPALARVLTLLKDASGALLAGVLIANRAGDHATATQRLASIDALRGGLQRAIATLLHAGQAVASTVDPVRWS